MESNIKGLVSAGHEMASELKAECGAVDMRSVAKLISDLATQLEVQLVRANALAAENAKLKKFCKDAAFDADYEAELGMERGGFSDALNEIKTPATDAFLAEVRAQGVEMFAESQKEYVRKNRNELDSMTRAAYCGSAVDAERFAAELRKGGNQ
ncbi:TPA: hypothetical protein KW042_000972 [Escherichia coli]|uniref:hypothetical protein n=1 Tax=Escherichia coli TaxID=562 RepID=UPI001E634DD1|nr:hypothetical protein [Escherichia coli]EHH5029321.1 hypothetical protein [Escherichia coli]MDC7911781.1 hypothetical protein [Escherichia coli]MDC7922397.1 hypothetical protein [Escherichia coli]WHI17995.1 hypothetical protein QDW69_06715 [Escherichia coli]HBH7726965.1 hypothetical protein [Escherichia coli]